MPKLEPRKVVLLILNMKLKRKSQKEQQGLTPVNLALRSIIDGLTGSYLFTEWRRSIRRL